MSDSSPGGLQWTQAWAKLLRDGSYGVLLFNRGAWGGCLPCAQSAQGCACIGLQFSQIGKRFNDSRFSDPKTKFKVRYTQNHSDAGVYQGQFPRVLVPPHGSLLLRVTAVA